MRFITFRFIFIFLHCTEPGDWGLPWMKAFRTVWDGRHCVMHMLLCPHTPNIPDTPPPKFLNHTYLDTLGHTHIVTPLPTPTNNACCHCTLQKWHNRLSADWVCLNWAAWCSNAEPLWRFNRCIQLKLSRLFYRFKKGANENTIFGPWSCLCTPVALQLKYSHKTHVYYFHENPGVLSCFSSHIVFHV